MAPDDHPHPGILPGPPGGFLDRLRERWPLGHRTRRTVVVFDLAVLVAMAVTGVLTGVHQHEQMEQARRHTLDHPPNFEALSWFFIAVVLGLLAAGGVWLLGVLAGHLAGFGGLVTAGRQLLLVAALVAAATPLVVTAPGAVVLVRVAWGLPVRATPRWLWAASLLAGLLVAVAALG